MKLSPINKLFKLIITNQLKHRHSSEKLLFVKSLSEFKRGYSPHTFYESLQLAGFTCLNKLDDSTYVVDISLFKAEFNPDLDIPQNILTRELRKTALSFYARATDSTHLDHWLDHLKKPIFKQVKSCSSRSKILERIYNALMSNILDILPWMKLNKRQRKTVFELFEKSLFSPRGYHSELDDLTLNADTHFVTVPSSEKVSYSRKICQQHDISAFSYCDVSSCFVKIGYSLAQYVQPDINWTDRSDLFDSVKARLKKHTTLYAAFKTWYCYNFAMAVDHDKRAMSDAIFFEVLSETEEQLDDLLKLDLHDVINSIRLCTQNTYIQLLDKLSLNDIKKIYIKGVGYKKRSKFNNVTQAMHVINSLLESCIMIYLHDNVKSLVSVQHRHDELALYGTLSDITTALQKIDHLLSDTLFKVKTSEIYMTKQTIEETATSVSEETLTPSLVAPISGSEVSLESNVTVRNNTLTVNTDSAGTGTCSDKIPPAKLIRPYFCFAQFKERLARFVESKRDDQDFKILIKNYASIYDIIKQCSVSAKSTEEEFLKVQDERYNMITYLETCHCTGIEKLLRV
jgi:hypothetical protein